MHTGYRILDSVARPALPALVVTSDLNMKKIMREFPWEKKPIACTGCDQLFEHETDHLRVPAGEKK